MPVSGLVANRREESHGFTGFDWFRPLPELVKLALEQCQNTANRFLLRRYGRNAAVDDAPTGSGELLVNVRGSGFGFVHA